MSGGTCKARRYNDQMQCGRCGLAWDVNDPEPPPCRLEEQERVRRETGRRALDNIKRILSNDNMPGL